MTVFQPKIYQFSNLFKILLDIDKAHKNTLHPLHQPFKLREPNNDGLSRNTAPIRRASLRARRGRIPHTILQSGSPHRQVCIDQPELCANYGGMGEVVFGLRDLRGHSPYRRLVSIPFGRGSCPTRSCPARSYCTNIYRNCWTIAMLMIFWMSKVIPQIGINQRFFVFMDAKLYD